MNGEEKQRGFGETCLGLDEEIQENIYAPVSELINNSLNQ